MNAAATQAPTAHAVPPISPFMWRWFGWYAERFLRRSFHAVRLDRGGGSFDVPRGVPLIVFSNHPSWWDPMVAIFLARRCFPDRRHYWPIDAEMLRKYRFFAKLGFFGIEQGSPRGGAAFLRTARRVLGQADACLWVTAEGEFADVRRRPVQLRPGLAHLVRKAGRCVVLPVCVEYAFWTERTPEVLLRVGQAIEVSGRTRDAAEWGVEEWQAQLARRLEENLDALATTAMTRQTIRFTTLLGGATGTTRTYDLWRRLRAAVGRRRFDAAHAPEPLIQKPGVNRP